MRFRIQLTAGITLIAAVARPAACISAQAAPPRISAQPAPPHATITEDLRLDASTEDFPRVRTVYVGPRGQIVVVITPDEQMRVYDAAGRRIASLGRIGSGPGEFRQVSGIGWKADTMWAHDGAQRRMTYYAPGGALVRTTPNATFDPPPSDADREKARAEGRGIPLSSIAPLAVQRDGSIVGQRMLPVTDSRPNRVSFGGDIALVRVAADGSAQRQLAVLPWRGDERWAMTVDMFGRQVPFAMVPAVAVAVDGGRFAHAVGELTARSGGTFTITLLRATADTAFVRSYPFSGVPIPGAVRDSALAAMLPPPGRATEGSPDMPQRFQAIAREKMPPVYPAFEQLVIGLDNTVWVGSRRSADGQSFLVLNGRGDPVATVVIPANSRLRQASATHAYVTETDADGLVSVVRYRITGVSCGRGGCW